MDANNNGLAAANATTPPVPVKDRRYLRSLNVPGSIWGRVDLSAERNHALAGAAAERVLGQEAGRQTEDGRRRKPAPRHLPKRHVKARPPPGIVGAE